MLFKNLKISAILFFSSLAFFSHPHTLPSPITPFVFSHYDYNCNFSMRDNFASEYSLRHECTSWIIRLVPTSLSLLCIFKGIIRLVNMHGVIEITMLMPQVDQSLPGCVIWCKVVVVPFSFLYNRHSDCQNVPTILYWVTVCCFGSDFNSCHFCICEVVMKWSFALFFLFDVCLVLFINALVFSHYFPGYHIIVLHACRANPINRYI